MARDQIKEFLNELENTNLSFVREKQKTGGYGRGWQAKHAKEFLDQKDAEEAREQALREKKFDRTVKVIGLCLTGMALAIAAANYLRVVP